MKKHIFLILSIISFPTAYASPLMINTIYDDNKVISDPVTITLQIDKKIIKVKNDPNSASVELDPSLRGKSIESASFLWIRKGKTYFCKADHLPLRILVSKENVHAGTTIHFNCSKVK